MTLIIHGDAFHTCTQGVLTTLEELNVEDYRIAFVDLRKGEHKSPSFLKLQVNHVPNPRSCHQLLGFELAKACLQAYDVWCCDDTIEIPNPFGQIPVLQDGDITIFETRAIVRYLSEKFAGQGTALLGHSLKDKALVSQWLEVESKNYNPAASSIVIEKVYTPMFGAVTNDEVVAAQTAKLEKVLEVYEAHLAKSKFLAGEFFSLAVLE